MVWQPIQMEIAAATIEIRQWRSNAGQNMALARKFPLNDPLNRPP